MVAGQAEFGFFFVHRKVAQFFLHRELIAESQSVIGQTETEVQQPARSVLLHGDEQFVMVVADFTVLSPYWLPGSVAFRSLCVGHRKVAVELIIGTHAESQLALLDDVFSFVLQGIEPSAERRNCRVRFPSGDFSVCANIVPAQTSRNRQIMLSRFIEWYVF